MFLIFVCKGIKQLWHLVCQRMDQPQLFLSLDLPSGSMAIMFYVVLALPHSSKLTFSKLPPSTQFYLITPWVWRGSFLKILCFSPSPICPFTSDSMSLLSSDLSLLWVRGCFFVYHAVCFCFSQHLPLLHLKAFFLGFLYTWLWLPWGKRLCCFYFQIPSK